MLRITAPAKLNLFLHVTGKRPDGYHLLESLAVFTEFSDALEIAPATDLMLEIVGPYAHELQPDADNLVLRAARLLQAQSDCRKGAHITLHKHIPVGAGLGGGSADAAAALRGLMTLWEINSDAASLQAMALRLGSDVPVCLASQTAWMSGIGENITTMACDASPGILLVNPGISLLTAQVFRQFSGEFAAPAAMPEPIDSVEALLDAIQMKQNMLEKPARSLLPVIGDMLTAIAATAGCKLARMSGSGATCFGLYENRVAAQAAATSMQSYHPQWWCVATGLAT